MKSRMRITLFALSALVVIPAAACHRDNQPPSALQSQTRDSAGIRIVENPTPPAGSRLGWRIGSEPGVSIGRRDGEESYLLYGAGDATILADGRILVANGGSGELRFFDSAGSHLATRGGQGEGPGEFLQLRSLEPWPGDSIVAWYGPRQNVSVFDNAGNYARTIEINDASDPWAWRLASTSVRGSILAVLLLEYADTLVMELRDGEGGLRTSLGAHPSWQPAVLVDEGTEREMQHVPTFAREPVWGMWGDLAALGVTSRYEIRAYGADGSLARIVRREHGLRVPTPEDVEAYIESRILLYHADATPSEQEYHRRNYRSAPVAERFPVFTTIMVDELDHLWIREYDHPREERPAPLWTVFDPQGHVLGFVETPAELRMVYEIGEDYILGHSMDELGVEMIQVWPLERASS
ncbi:MAG: hypothetical protein OXQ93_03535 [Gemmatimonadota bacterium]|nr:hypothetical protein [bacterium]MDE2874488.1 hypothetical protein [Gemmatimonadota bacterium]